MKPAMIRVVTRNGSDGHAHDLEGVDLLVDPHGADLRGETAADGRRQRQAGHQRRDLPGVEVRREEAGERRRAELVEGRVALQADLGAGEEGEEGDDADRAADDRQGAGAEGDLGQQPEGLLLVAPQGARGPGERPAVEAELVAEVVEGAQRLPVDLLELAQADPDAVGRSREAPSLPLRRHELEVDRGDHEVHREQQQERDDDGLVHRVTDALGPTSGAQPLVGGDDGRRSGRRSAP